MKHKGLLILTLIFVSCSTTSQLNKRIDKDQQASLLNSPFVTAKGMTSELMIQKKFRIQYLPDLESLIQNHSNDTIILSENYDFICIDCPSDDVRILINNKLIIYRIDSKYKYYQKQVEFISKEFESSDLYEFRNELRKDRNWNSKSERYGTDKCFDGGHTFYTVIYPSGDLISMYMRCWVPKDLRKRTEGNNNP